MIKEKRNINFWKVLAIILGILSVGAIQETSRILTSMDADIAHKRSSLIPMAFVMTTAFIVGALYCWRKSKQTNF